MDALFREGGIRRRLKYLGWHKPCRYRSPVRSDYEAARSRRNLFETFQLRHARSNGSRHALGAIN